MEGFLKKRSEWLHAWNTRYFSIDGSTLYYFDDKDGACRDGISLTNARITPRPFGDELGFIIEFVDGKVFHLLADDATSRQQWMDVLLEVASGSTVSRDGGLTTLGNGGLALSALLNGTPPPRRDEPAAGKEPVGNARIKIADDSVESERKPRTVVEEKVPIVEHYEQAPPTTTQQQWDIRDGDPLSYLVQESRPHVVQHRSNINNGNQDGEKRFTNNHGVVHPPPPKSAAELDPIGIKEPNKGIPVVEKDAADSSSNKACNTGIPTPLIESMFSLGLQDNGSRFPTSLSGLRSAILAGNETEVKRLLAESPSLANLRDAHAKSGADVMGTNAQGIPAFDQAGPMLQHKLKEYKAS